MAPFLNPYQLQRLAMLAGQQQQQPVQQPQRRSVWDRINEGVGRIFGAPSSSDPDLNPQEIADMRRSALLNAGANMLISGGRGESFGEGLGRAMQAGQEGAQQGLAFQDIMRQRKQQQELREKIGPLIAQHDISGLETLMGEMLSLGNVDGARVVSETIKALLYTQQQEAASTSPPRTEWAGDTLMEWNADTRSYRPAVDGEGNPITRPETPAIIQDPYTGEASLVYRRDGVRVEPIGPVKSPRPEPSHLRAQEVRAAAGTLMRAVETAEQLEDADPESAVMPIMAAGARDVGNLPFVGGAVRGFTEGTAQRLMSPNQQRYRQAADVFTHNYTATLPKARVSPVLIRMINETFFPKPGQTDPTVIAQFRQKRRDAAERLQRALNGQSIDLSGLPGFEGLTPSDIINPSAESAPTTMPTATAPIIPPTLEDFEKKYGVRRP